MNGQSAAPTQLRTLAVACSRCPKLGHAQGLFVLNASPPPMAVPHSASRVASAMRIAVTPSPEVSSFRMRTVSCGAPRAYTNSRRTGSGTTSLIFLFSFFPRLNEIDEQRVDKGTLET